MTGVVTLSVEIELGWGVHDTGQYGHLSEDGRAEREFLARLLDRCADLDLPITFDVVGHLCESHCTGTHDGPHEPSWFDADPGTDVERDPLFYAPDMVDMVRSSPVDHELGTHTYSHVLCNEVTAETFAWEVERAQTQLVDLTGSETVSIVPPRHLRPSAGWLRDAGIEIERVSRDTSDRNRLSRLKELIYGPHPTFEPTLVDGVVETYCTSYPSLTSSALPSGQRDPLRPFATMPLGTRRRLQRRYLRRAAQAAATTDSHCHLWCHLFDLSNEAQWTVVDAFLGDLVAMWDRGDIDVLTMAALNDRVRDERSEVTARV